MGSDHDSIWDHRYYDSYRPAWKREASQEDRSPTIAMETDAVRQHSSKSRHRPSYPSNTKPKVDTSSTLKSSRGQSEDRNPTVAFVPEEDSLFIGRDPEQLSQMPAKKRKHPSMPDTESSHRSSRTVDSDKGNKSEAQSRGFYGSSRSSTSNVVHLGGYELKRPWEDEATDDSVKRRRATEEEDGEPVRASESHRPAQEYHCKNYMCMEDHTYTDCDKPKVCWGCRSTNHYWSYCPMTCTRCGKARHTAKYCEDFELTEGGKSWPRTNNPHPPTEPASHSARKEPLEHAHGQASLPKKPAKVVGPSRTRSKHRQASRNVTDPGPSSRHASQAQKPSRPEEKAPETAPDPSTQRLQRPSIPSSSSSGRNSTTSTPAQLTASTQAPGKTTTHTSTQPKISPRDPRRRQSSTVTPLLSPLQSLQMAPEPGDTSSVKPEMLGAPPSTLFHRRPPPPPIQQEEEEEPTHRRAWTQQEASAPPPITSTPPPLTTLAARLAAFDASERLKQQAHETALGQKRAQQSRELEAALEDKIRRRTTEAEEARREAVERMDAEHSRCLEELRRR